MKILSDLISNFDVCSLKVSFEDEGATILEANEIISMAHSSGILATVKVGGPEAKSDILTCANLGVDNIVAPMVESRFAARKFIDACKLEKHILQSSSFYVNALQRE